MSSQDVIAVARCVEQCMSSSYVVFIGFIGKSTHLCSNPSNAWCFPFRSHRRRPWRQRPCPGQGPEERGSERRKASWYSVSLVVAVMLVSGGLRPCEVKLQQERLDRLREESNRQRSRLWNVYAMVVFDVEGRKMKAKRTRREVFVL